ncbi:GNAT family N-acetyltransferase [Mycobacterium sp. B14F4]|uniref:GNAT family N-acetyltransferase n=1 Tax=Mycobacterium sp. B14F4 TaxID=3153565 RepID=UPI00325EB2B3
MAALIEYTVVHPAELSESELRRWREIQRDAPMLGSPFLSPEFTLAVGAIQPRSRVAVLRDGAEVVGFFPFERRSLGYGVPIGAWYSDCQGIVHSAGLEFDARQLLRACGLAVWEFNHLVEGQTHFEPYKITNAASPIMDLSAGFQPLLATLRKNSNSKFKDVLRLHRKLEREVGPLRFVYQSQDHAALRTVMAWKSAQYLRTGTADKFARRWFVDLFDQLFATTSESFSGVLSMLYAGDEPVAGHFGLRSDRVMAYWFPAFDRRYGPYSPGLILNLFVAEAAAGSGIGHVDLGAGPEEYKRWFRTGELTLSQGRVARRSPGAALYSIRRASSATARQAVTSHPSLLRTVKRARSSYFRMSAAIRGRQVGGSRRGADQMIKR